MGRHWNVELLKERCDLRELVEDLEIPTSRSGATLYMQCLNPDHERETRFDHCECNETYAHCYSCGWNADTIGVVMAWQEKKRKDSSKTDQEKDRRFDFDAACETIARFLGNPNQFLLSGEEQTKVFPFSNDELRAAGFCVDHSTRKFLQALYDREPDFVLSVIRNKLDENTETLSEVLKLVPLRPDIRLEAEQEYRAATRFRKRLSGQSGGKPGEMVARSRLRI